MCAIGRCRVRDILVASCIRTEASSTGGLWAIAADGAFRVDAASGRGLAWNGDVLVRTVHVGRPHFEHHGTELRFLGTDSPPRTVWVPDLLRPHDLIAVAGGFVAVSTGTGSLLWLDGDGALRRRQQFGPGGDAWHLNCVFEHEGRLLASAFGRFNRHRGWVDRLGDGRGIVFDVESGRDLVVGLDAPHHPCVVDGTLLVCDSQNRRVVRADIESGELLDMVRLRRWTRGIAVDGDVVYVGESGHRDDRVGTASIAVLDRTGLQVLDRIQLPAGAIYDLALVPATVVAALGRTPAAAPENLQAMRALTRRQARGTISVQLPSRMHQGELRLLDAEVHNQGSQELRTAGTRPVHLASRWYDPARASPPIEGVRGGLPITLAPGARVASRMPLLAPNAPGRYELQVGLVQEHVRWFRGQSVGIVEVVAPPTEVAAVPGVITRRGDAPGAKEPSDIGSTLEAWARKTPDAVAVDGAMPITYGELEERSAAIARQLVSRLGAGGANVAVLTGDTLAFVTGLFGVLRAGHAAVPLGTDEPGAGQDAVTARAGAVLTLTPADVERLATRQCRSDALPRVDQDVGALVLFASASIGRPLRVVRSHRCELHQARTLCGTLDAGPGTRWGMLLSPAFAGAYVSLFGALITGGTLVACDGHGLPGVPAFLADRHVDTTSICASMAVPLLELAGAGSLPLRDLVIGGDAITGTRAHAARSLVAPHGRVWGIYASTEVGLPFVHELGADVAPGPEPVPLGRPRVGHGLRIDEDGEIVLRSRFMATGYFNDPQKTARAFAPVAGTDEVEYRTGDVGRLVPGGGMLILGRADRIVKIRGHRVELGAVEDAIQSIHGVDKAVVMVRGVAERAHLAAFVVRAPAAGGLAVADVRAELSALLPSYSRPNQLTIVDELPRGVDGS